MLVNASCAKKIVLACVALHNFLKSREKTEFESTDSADSDVQSTTGDRNQATSALVPLRVAGGTGRLNNDAKRLRDKLAEYFVTTGSVSWQEAIVGVS